MRRKTNQRNAIQEVFQQKDQPMGVSEILQIGRQTVQSMNQATAYRNLKLLVAKGWLRTISTPELGMLYG
jgi:Fur family transcriptional regulator, ferric uptake regulator